MKKIFICYRRDDSEGYAGRLFDRLQLHYPGRVFMDTANIPAGVDFVAEIRKVIRDCFAVLVVIGPRWLAPGSDGIPRLRASRDLVRLEIVEAFRSKASVIPVLIQGARMPEAKDLPRGTAKLSRRNAVELRHRSFDTDCQELIRALEPLAAKADAARSIVTVPGRNDDGDVPASPAAADGESVVSRGETSIEASIADVPSDAPGAAQATLDAGADDEDESLESFKAWLDTLRR